MSLITGDVRKTTETYSPIYLSSEFSLGIGRRWWLRLLIIVFMTSFQIRFTEAYGSLAKKCNAIWENYIQIDQKKKKKKRKKRVKPFKKDVAFLYEC